MTLNGRCAMKSYKRVPIDGVNCPFCLRDGSKILYEVTSEEAATHFVSPWRDRVRNLEVRAIIERLWGKTACKVVECKNCSGVFAFPFVSGDTDFYETAMGSSPYPSERWEYGESLRLCGASSGIASVLEIGAGKGAFVRRLIDAGIPSTAITVLEYSSSGMSAVRSQYPGVVVKHGDDLTKLADGSFSHVFLFQVLEHLGDLDGFMRNLYRLLKMDGLAFASVPHPSRTEFGELSGLTLDMPPNHLSRFSRDAINSLSSRNNLLLETLVDENFTWKQAFPEYLRFRFAKLVQEKGSVPARIDARLVGRSRKIAASIFALTLVPEALLKISTSCRTGASRLFVLRKATQKASAQQEWQHST